MSGKFYSNTCRRHVLSMSLTASLPWLGMNFSECMFAWDETWTHPQKAQSVTLILHWPPFTHDCDVRKHCVQLSTFAQKNKTSHCTYCPFFFVLLVIKALFACNLHHLPPHFPLPQAQSINPLMKSQGDMYSVVLVTTATQLLPGQLVQTSSKPCTGPEQHKRWTRHRGKAIKGWTKVQRDVGSHSGCCSPVAF